MKQTFLLFLFLLTLSALSAQNMVSYAYDNAGNRISRKIVTLPSNIVKKDTLAPAPVEEQLGERKITVFPNPTKGSLAVEINGGNSKPATAGGDQLQIFLFSAQGVQLQNTKVEAATTPINMTSYPAGWYILRVQAGDKMTEFKIVKSN